MPRSKKSEEEIVSDAPVRKARARAPRNTSDDTVVRKRAPRKPRAVPASEVVEVEEVPRKAPTPIAFEAKLKKQSSRTWIMVVVVCLGSLVGGVAIGMTDQGPIDVVAIVTERNEKVIRGEVRDASGGAVTQTVPVQNADARPNGGLQPAAAESVPVPEVQENATIAPEGDTASSTATTTTQTISAEEMVGGSAVSTTTTSVESAEEADESL